MGEAISLHWLPPCSWYCLKIIPQIKARAQPLQLELVLHEVPRWEGIFHEELQKAHFVIPGARAVAATPPKCGQLVLLQR